MKYFILIARRTKSPYAVEQIYSFIEDPGKARNNVSVIKVNVPHYSLIYPALLQIEQKIKSGKFSATEESRKFVHFAISALNGNRLETPSRELISFIAKETNNKWLTPSRCLCIKGE